jgi:hypothetical protein
VWGGDDGIAANADVLEAACGAAVMDELVSVIEGGEGGDRATAMVLLASVPAVGFTV